MGTGVQAARNAKKASRRADKGLGLLTTEGFLAGMEQRAKAAQQHIRAAVAAKNQRSTRDRHEHDYR